MIDTTLVRLIAQVALTAWCTALIILLFASRGDMLKFAGMRFAVTGLICFGLWQFLASISLKDAQILPRSTLVPFFAVLETGTAVAAWGWLAISAERTFHFSFRPTSHQEYE